MIEGIIFAIISMVGFGFYQFFLKNIKDINIYSSLIYVHIFLVLSLIPLIFTGFILPDHKTSILILLASLLGAINIPFLYKAISSGKLSIVIPIANTYSLPAVIFAYLFFGEVLSISKYLAGILIIFGVTLIVLKREEIKNFKIEKEDTKGVLYAIIFSLGLSLYSVLLRQIEAGVGPYLGMFYTEFFILIFLGIYFFSGKVNLQKLKRWKYPILAGFFQAIGGLFFFLGIKYANVSIASIIGAANPLIVLILAFTFLKEKIEWNQLVGIIITVIGLVGLVF